MPDATVTFLFTDIVGSTRQWEQSTDMAQRVDHHFTVLRRAVATAGGEVFATMGDGIAAAFASADAAVGAAIEAQRDLPASGLAVRMGIHTGTVVKVDDDYRGPPVNRTARITALAHGGQILLSNVSATLVRSGSQPMTLLDLGSHGLRDLTHPEHVWQVVHPELTSAFPPVRGVATWPTNLPTSRSSLVGRECDVREVAALLRQHRIVTLTGVGGVGKTRLAVQAAAESLSDFAQVWFVGLHGVAEADEVPGAISRAIGAPVVADAFSSIVAVLSGERALLVLDNCEQVVDGAAAVLDALTVACPQLCAITTSREPLSIEGEHVLGVRPLDPTTAAVELFRDRAASAGAADLDDVPRTAVEELCRRLDGIPLAIELAAARTATLGVTAVLGALDDRWALLRSGRRNSDRRHSTMWATIDWSFRLLEPAEQQLMRWMAVFPNGFELDATCHVAASIRLDGRAVTDAIASLVRKSVLVLETNGPAARYRMLETVRAFALERLDERGDRVGALMALVRWVASITDLPYADPCNATVERNAIRLEREVDSWREAVMVVAEGRSSELAGALCGPPVAFFLLGRHELGPLVRSLLDVTGDHPPHRRGVLCALIVSTAGTTDRAELGRLTEQMQLIDDQDPTGLAALMRWLELAWRGDFTASVELCLAGSIDLRFSQATRDLLFAIAVLDRFSLTSVTDDVDHLVARAMEVADRSDVALHRACCLLGAAWALADAAPDWSLELIHRALRDVQHVPALTRLTLPGSAARLLARLDPAVAARALLELMDATPHRRSFVDLIPLFYAAAVVGGAGRDGAPPSVASESMMDFVDLARRAAATSSGSLDELEAEVRARLSEIVAATHDGRRPALSA